MWVPLREEKHGHVVHVVPTDDLIEHDISGDECVCGPAVEFVENGGIVITHDSLDGREAEEVGQVR